jgi:hypothetical protein
VKGSTVRLSCTHSGYIGTGRHGVRCGPVTSSLRVRPLNKLHPASGRGSRRRAMPCDTLYRDTEFLLCNPPTRDSALSAAPRLAGQSRFGLFAHLLAFVWSTRIAYGQRRQILGALLPMPAALHWHGPEWWKQHTSRPAPRDARCWSWLARSAGIDQSTLNRRHRVGLQGSTRYPAHVYRRRDRHRRSSSHPRRHA